MKEFLGVRGFALFKGEILTSMSRKGSRSVGVTQISVIFEKKVHPYMYYGPKAWIPDHVLNKGIHYGFQSIHTPLTRHHANFDNAYLFIPTVVGLVQHYGTVKEFERTYISSHMMIRKLWVNNWVNKWKSKKVFDKLEQRYQCDVVPYDREEVYNGTWQDNRDAY